MPDSRELPNIPRLSAADEKRFATMFLAEHTPLKPATIVQSLADPRSLGARPSGSLFEWAKGTAPMPSQDAFAPSEYVADDSFAGVAEESVFLQGVERTEEQNEADATEYRQKFQGDDRFVVHKDGSFTIGTKAGKQLDEYHLNTSHKYGLQ